MKKEVDLVRSRVHPGDLVGKKFLIEKRSKKIEKVFENYCRPLNLSQENGYFIGRFVCN